MLRLLGFVVGAILTAVVLFDLDPHELLHRGEALVADSREWLPTGAQSPVTEAPTLEPINEPKPVEVRVDSAPGEQPAPIEAAEQGAAVPDDPARDQAIQGHEEPPPAMPVPVVSPMPTGGWQPLWRPFNSEASARGFAGQISDITGRETRVRRLGPRSHQVDVAYATEAERLDTLQRLELLTGIRLREEGL